MMPHETDNKSSTKSLDGEVRYAVSSDFRGMMEIVMNCGLFDLKSIDDLRSQIAKYLKNETKEQWLVCVEEEHVRGIAYCVHEQMTEGTFNILLIAVAPNHRARGIGKRLIHSVVENLTQRHARLLFVETSGLQSFTQTRLFYENCGFQQEARIRDFYQPGEDKIVYRRSLAAPSSAVSKIIS